MNNRKFVLIRYTLITVAVLFVYAQGSFSQDIHLSQYYASPQNLNPALTGVFDGDYRFAANQKTQWASVTVPYKTLSGAFDTRLFGSSLKNGMLGGGIILNNDKAGDSKLGMMQASGSLSYTIKADADARNFISLGAQGGYAQRSISYNDLRFDEQYDGDAYDASLPNGETFGSNGYSYADFSAGANWNYLSKKSFRSAFGIALFHLNEPAQQSFLNRNAENLSRKIVLNGNITFGLSDNTQLIPSFLVERQNKFRELIFGTTLRFGFEPAYGFSNSFYLGAHSRKKDALIFVAGMEYNNLNMGISYDVNTSGLKPASHSRGGFEFSLIYIIKKVPKLPGPKKPCPIFL